jgi:hypothetical protein
MRTNLIVSTLAAVLVLACNDPQDKQIQADKAQREANQAQVQDQAKADQKQREATLALEKAKADYHTKIGDVFSDIDKAVADLQAKNMTATGKDKLSNEGRISLLGTRRSVLTTDLKDIDLGSASGWDDLKTRVDNDIKDAKSALSPFASKT